MHNPSLEPNSGYNNSGYESEPDLTVGYSPSKEVRQGNFDDAYQENIYDLSNLADTPWTDSAVRSNPQFELELWVKKNREGRCGEGKNKDRQI